MTTCSCLVQEGQIPDQLKKELLSALAQFSLTSFGSEAQIAWVPVATGNGFTAGKPSTSSVVSFSANERLSAEHRETLLREFVALWTDKTGCSVDEIVAVIADPINE